MHSLAGGGALLTKDYHYQIRHLSPKAILATARLCSWYLMFTIWGLGLSLSWGWQGEDTGTGSMVQRVGVLHTGQHWTVMHIILGVSPVSVGPCMCAVRTQVTEDRPLKKCNCTTSTAQDQPSAGQGNIELSLERGRGCAASTAHRESYGGAGPGSRSQYCEYRWRGDGGCLVSNVGRNNAQVRGRGKGDESSTSYTV